MAGGKKARVKAVKSNAHAQPTQIDPAAASPAQPFRHEGSLSSDDKPTLCSTVQRVNVIDKSTEKEVGRLQMRLIHRNCVRPFFRQVMLDAGDLFRELAISLLDRSG